MEGRRVKTLNAPANLSKAGQPLRSAFTPPWSILLATLLITLAFQAGAVGQAAVLKAAQNNTSQYNNKMTTTTPTTVAPAALVPATQTTETERAKMNGKPVLNVTASTVINFDNAKFKEKLLCDGLTLNLGRGCVYTCSFCYVGPQIWKLNYKILKPAGLKHRDAVIRIEKPLEILLGQLIDEKTQEPKYKSPDDTRVIYSSTLVDVAANMDLVRETAAACTIILENTFWQIRLLTKSNLLPSLVEIIPEQYHQRLILGVSTGTLDDKLASAFEQGCPLPSKRLKSLHWLQDHGFRTFGMLCPSLPQKDYPAFAREMLDAIRVDMCEHVWAEVINVRGESLKLTVACLREAGFDEEASALEEVSGDRKAWEKYSWDTFCAYTDIMPVGKLRYLQY